MNSRLVLIVCQLKGCILVIKLQYLNTIATHVSTIMLACCPCCPPFLPGCLSEDKTFCQVMWPTWISYFHCNQSERSLILLFSLQPIRSFTWGHVTWLDFTQDSQEGKKWAARQQADRLTAVVLVSYWAQKQRKQFFNWQRIRTRQEILYILVIASGHKAKSPSSSWFGSTSLNVLVK